MLFRSIITFAWTISSWRGQAGTGESCFWRWGFGDVLLREFRAVPAEQLRGVPAAGTGEICFWRWGFGDGLVRELGALPEARRRSGGRQICSGEERQSSLQETIGVNVVLHQLARLNLVSSGEHAAGHAGELPWWLRWWGLGLGSEA